MRARRAFLLFASLTMGASWSVEASTPALVIDAGSGKVLYQDQATVPWYPASVTKLMTTYVALDLVRQGRVSMGSILSMSPEAAAQPPSKIGLKPGQTMTLDNALKIIMVKSANDIATMIGENLGGGSVEGFAELMNAASRRLGMHQSRWTNPSGLPDDRQQSSARDMAVLARALINEFPEHEALFHIGAVKLGNRVMRNHNGLLGRYAGVDGMKTGFICSGGFNIVASATQNGRRIITVVFGYGSARERDLRAADLFDAGFSSSGGLMAQRVDELPPSAVMSPPNMRPIVCGGGRRQPAEEDETAVVAAAPSAESGSADNPIASFFSSSAFAAASSPTPLPGTRRTLGPRAVFEPVIVWAGARPGAEPDDEEAAPRTRGGRLAKASKSRRNPAVPATMVAGSGDSPKPSRSGRAAKPQSGAGAVAALNPEAAKPAGGRRRATASSTAEAKPQRATREKQKAAAD